MSSMQRVVGVMLFAVVGWLCPAASHAQFAPAPSGNEAVGEQYHIEAALEFWHPPLNLLVASERLGIAGTQIDASTDLGLENKMLTEFRVVLRPARKHKFRFNYLPMKYSGEAIVQREFVFNGQRFGLNLPITSQLEWTTTLLAYEYDFFYHERGFVGFTLNSKFTKVRVDVNSPAVGPEFALAQAPVPTIGGIARIYVTPFISITGDVNGIKIPDSLNSDYKAHYLDFDLYGTVNFTNYVGAQVGYRNIDVGYRFKQDEGTFKMRGLYFGGVVRY